MMNRRQLMCMGGAALFAYVPKARAATYDLLIKGGRVIDPSVGLDAIRDIAIAAGKIVAVEADIAGDASQTIDARIAALGPAQLLQRLYERRVAGLPFRIVGGQVHEHPPQRP